MTPVFPKSSIEDVSSWSMGLVKMSAECYNEPLTLEQDMAQLIVEDYRLRLSCTLTEIYPESLTLCEARIIHDKGRHVIELRRRHPVSLALKPEEEIAYMLGHELTHALQVERDARGDWMTFCKLYFTENERVGYIENCFEVEARVRGKDMAAKLCGLHQLELVSPNDSQVYVP